MGKTLYLSVVIPSYDEMANLQKGVLEKVKRFLDKKKFVYEVIVVDDGSRDGSSGFIKKFARENPNFYLVENPHLGKAGAVTTGMLSAKGEYVLFTDMDQATPIEEVNKLLPFFHKEYDIVIGSRSQRKGAPWTRKLMAKGMVFLRTMIVGIHGISDTQCGFKMFTRAAAKRLFTEIKEIHGGFHAVSGSSVSAGFDVELLYIAQKLGYKIHEVPVSWLYVETRRVSPIRDSLDGLADLIRIRVNEVHGRYKRII